VLADRSKIGKPGTIYYLPVTEIDMLITDRDASGEQLALLRRAGVGEVIEVGTP